MKRKLLVLMAVLMAAVSASAEDFVVDGIAYNILTAGDGGTVEVTQKDSYYTGSVVIPEKVTNGGSTYTVTAIGKYAFYYSSGLTSVVIPNSVTQIKDYGFCNTGLTTVDIPNSVSSIGSWAFGSSKLTSVVIPNSVTTFEGLSTFCSCSNLVSVVLPNSITEIPYGMFAQCSSLTSITIPSSVTSIGNTAFNNCPLREIISMPTTPPTLGTSNFNKLSADCVVSVPASALSAYTTANGWKDLSATIIPSKFEADGIAYNILSWEDKTVEVVSKANEVKYTGAVTIPSTVNGYTVTAIGEQAFFYCSGLTSVEIPNSVTEIGENAFNLCENLADIVIPSSVTTIGENAFKNCSSFKNITIPNSITSLSRYIFENCSGLETIVIPSSVTSIGSAAFRCCESLTEVKLPENLTGLGDAAFSYCNALTSVNIPRGVSTLGENTFRGCPLKSIIAYPSTPPSLGTDCFYNLDANCVIAVPASAMNAYQANSAWNSLGTIIPSSFEVGDFAYNVLSGYDRTVEVTENRSGYSGDIEIPETVTYEGREYTVTGIGEYAFYGCWQLESLKIPNTVTTIGYWAIGNSSNLKKVEIGTGVTTIGERAFNGSFRLEEVIMQGTTPPTLGADAFLYTSETCVVTVPASAISSYKAADGWNDQTLQTTCKLGGIAYKVTSTPTANTAEVIASTSKYEGEFNIPSSITASSLGNMTFTVTAIGEKAFSNCTDLTSITLPETLTTIKEQAFYWCTGLTSVVIPNSVTTIERAAFNQCWSITSINIPEGITELTDYVFGGCRLSSVTIPSTVTSIGKYALSCSFLTSIISLPTTPPTLADETSINTDYSSTLTVKVPALSYKRYTEADYWKDFTNITYDAPVLDLADGDPYTVDYTYDNATINYSRSFNNDGWNALYLPFAMTYDEWEAFGDVAELNNVRQYDTDGDGVLDYTALEFDRVTTGAIKPNTPYVIKPKQAGDLSITHTGTLHAAPAEDGSVDCASTKRTFTLYGTYTEKSGLHAIGAYALSTSAEFVQAQSDEQKLKPQRIYLIIKERTDGNYNPPTPHNAPMRIGFTVDGETTAIGDIEILRENNGTYYDLSGRKVSQPAHGIFIQNGKKVFIK